MSNGGQDGGEAVVMGLNQDGGGEGGVEGRKREGEKGRAEGKRGKGRGRGKYTRGKCWREI